MKCPYCSGTGEITELTVGALILFQRQSKGLTQIQLASAAGLSRATDR